MSKSLWATLFACLGLWGLTLAGCEEKTAEPEELTTDEADELGKLGGQTFVL